jgi:ABC-2 type transport system ATP-binding protein
MRTTTVDPALANGHRDVAPDAAVEANALTKHYGDKVAVDNLTLRIDRGEIFGLLGPNGAGKTTTILMLLGLSTPTSGTARVDGLDPARDALEIKRRVGYMPDDVGFYDELTGRQNLAYTASLNRLTRREARERIDAVLHDVGLSPADADRKVRGYSRGMRQRLGLADALVKDPSVLILDEPTVNIDPAGVEEMLSLVTRLRDERGVTVLLSSHLLNQVEQICDRIGLFIEGRLAAVGGVEELANSTTSRWVVELRVDGADDAAADAVRAITGVTAVHRDGDTWEVTATRDVRAEIADAVVDAGGRLLHLARTGADLDALYRHYFRREDGSDDGDDH